ncbi:M6 family metalloprotease domain-containing protein [Geobacter sulfurreducens]|uniref:M6 family metalloprotease domain-containing protein n=1 Tax=Geobacter sulfurreducens TaxID=35554 RepID=UPI0001D8F16F|nr:M6 family metalloprotease domain-containing protein [Geobacter sulfurreducens]ADI85769.1 metalloprotease domain protein [Geobacter sulfurreducens KN400]UTG92329.1 M6 family metalloprotease domain-containing protein [Geobacter sulfurreducens]
MWTRIFSIALSLMMFASVVQAGPASPDWIDFEQPDGSAFIGKKKGDEFQKWVETDTGYTVIRNKANRAWEYAEKAPDGTLRGSGVQVFPGQSAPASIGKGLRPPRDKVAIVKQNRAMNEILQERTAASTAEQSAPAEMSASESSFAPGDWTPTPVSGTRKILMVLVNFSDRSLATTAQGWYDSVFSTTPGVKSVANFYKDNSFNTLSITPVTHSQAGNPDGVVTVTVPHLHPDNGTTESTWVIAAINAASSYVNFAALDTNANGFVDRTEAVVYFVVAGYEESGTSKTPSVWAHATSYGSGWFTAAGMKFQNYALNGELNHYDVQHPMGVIAHEMGHQICGLPDLYDTASYNAGLGTFSLMASGSWGGDTNEYGGTTPTALDAWSRQYLGWTTPVAPDTPGAITIGHALSSSSAALKFMNSAQSTSEYFLAENRYPTGWDLGNRRYLGSGWSGGLLITHVDVTSGTQGYNDINRYVAGGHQGVMAEQASTASCNMATSSCRGHSTTLFYSGNSAAFTDGSAPNSRYYSGIQSGINITGISAPGTTMSLTYGVTPTPTTAVTLTPGVASPQPVATNVTFTASGSGGTGSYEYEFYLLAPGTSTWVKKQAYSSTATWAWSTSGLAAGTYQVCAFARTAGTSPAIGYDTYKVITFTLNALPPATGVTLTPSVASPQNVATSVTFTAAGAGGTGSYEYEFYTLAPGSKAWVKQRAYSSTTAWAWNTAGAKAGTWQVCVWTKSAGTAPRYGYDTYKIITYTLNALPATTSVTLTPSVASPKTIGTAVTFTAAGAGGTGSYEYEFYTLAPGSKTWVKQRAYSSTATWAWNTTGLAAGAYQVCVWAKSANSGPAAGYDTYKVLTYELKSMLVSLTPSVASPQNVATSVTFTATGSGGSGSYEYEFYTLAPGATAWVKQRAYSSTATWAWNTAGAKAGTWQVCVWTKNTGTSPATGYDSYALVTYTLNALAPATAVTLAPSVASPKPIGTSVTFTAAGAGGTGSYEYEFYTLAPGSKTWVKQRTYNSTATWAWNTTGLAAGTWQVCVWAKSANSGPATGYDTYKILTYEIKPIVTSLTSSVASPQDVATSVTFTAAAAGSSGSFEYEFYILPPGGSWTKKQAYSSTVTWTWDTAGAKAGTWQVCVWVKNAGTSPAAGYDAYALVTYTLSALAPATAVTLTPNVASPQAVGGTSITFTAEGSGGTGTFEYEFYLLAPGTSTWVKKQTYGTNDAWEWDTTGLAKGTYQVCVWAKSAGSGPTAGYDTYKTLSYALN